MATEQTPKLGDLARDVVTGYVGIVVAETVWLNGCVRLLLQHREPDKDGNIREAKTFDVQQLEVVERAAVASFRPAEPKLAAVATGGPNPDPVQRQDPVR